MFKQRPKAIQPRVHPNSSTGESRLVRRGHGSLNAELFQKLYFATSSKQALPDHTENQAELKLSAPTNMKSFNVPAKYVQSSAPSPQRSHCTYAHEYHSMPLDDAPVQREMRQLIASTSRQGSSTNQVIEGLSLSSATTNKAFYGQYGDKPAFSEPVQIVRPEGYIRLSAEARLGESRTVFQRDYPLYPEAMLRKAHGVAASKSADHLGVACRGPGRLDDMTSYKRVFGKDKPPGFPGAGPNSQSMGDLMNQARARQMAAFSGRNPPRKPA